MTQSAFGQIKDYESKPTLFFTDQGIVIQSKTKSPLLSLEETLAALEFAMEVLHVDGDVLIVKGKSHVTIDQMLERGFQISAIKPFLSKLDTTLFGQVLRASHWISWDNQSQFCGRCGSALKSKLESPEKHCMHCGLIMFPRFSPAVMVLIQRENEILLARSEHFLPGVYSAVAGFIGLGETAEQAAHREVKEELGIEISNLRYFSTQTWPFPDSFMIAFKANYLNGEINLIDKELEEARWFNLDNIPPIPGKASISCALIESAIADLKNNP